MKKREITDDQRVSREMYSRLWHLIEDHPYLSGMMCDEYHSYLSSLASLRELGVAPRYGEDGNLIEEDVGFNINNPPKPNHEWDDLSYGCPPPEVEA